MQENIGLNVGKEMGSDRRSVGFQHPDTVEQVVEDMQYNTRLPESVKNIFISLAVRVVGEKYNNRVPESAEKSITSLAAKISRYSKEETS